jgi:hypothetical protein
MKHIKSFESEKYREAPKFVIGDRVKVYGEIDEREFDGNIGTVKQIVAQGIETNMSWFGKGPIYLYNGLTYKVVFDELDSTYGGDDSSNFYWWCVPWNMTEIEKSNIKEEDIEWF